MTVLAHFQKCKTQFISNTKSPLFNAQQKYMNNEFKTGNERKLLFYLPRGHRMN